MSEEPNTTLNDIIQHKDIPNQHIHQPYRWNVADEIERLELEPEETDLWKLCFERDTGMSYIYQAGGVWSPIVGNVQSELTNFVNSAISEATESSSDGSFTFHQGRLSTITEIYPKGDKVTQFFYTSGGAVNRVEETYDGQKKTTQFNYNTAGDLVGYNVTMEAA